MSESNREGEPREQCKEAKFVDDNFAKLNERVTSVMPIADDLKSLGMLHGEKYEEIKAEKTNPAKMRKLFESLQSGDKVKTAFYNLLEKHEPHLFEDLGGVSRKRKLADPESPVPCKRLNTESNEQNNPHFNSASTSGSINIVTNIVNETRPSNYMGLQYGNDAQAPQKVKKTPAPKKVKSPAPKKVKKDPAPQKVKAPAPQKVKKDPAPKKVKAPAPQKVKAPAPQKVKAPAPQKVKAPAPQKVKAPTTKKVKKTPAPQKVKAPAPQKVKAPAPQKVKAPAPQKVKAPTTKKVKKTPAPQKVKAPAPKKVKKTPAPQKVKGPAPKKVKKAAARK